MPVTNQCQYKITGEYTAYLRLHEDRDCIIFSDSEHSVYVGVEEIPDLITALGDMQSEVEG